MKKVGRKAEAGTRRTKTILLKLTDEEYKKINDIAKKIEIPTTRFVRNLTLAGLEDADILNKLGVLKGVQKLIDFKERYLNPKKYEKRPAEKLKAV